VSDNGLSVTRRDLLKAAGGVAAVSAFGMSVPFVHAAESNTIQIALIGCGGRGTGAAEDAMSSKNGPVKLVAMADVFANNLEKSHKYLEKKFEKQVDVPKDKQFIGFDAYKKAIDCLKPGDVAIFTTPVAFRWVHFTYAIEKGVNVFMEKPVTVDGPSTRRMLKLGEESVKKNLKVGVGLMCRHSTARQELAKRIKDGEMGEILLMRAYRLQGKIASCFTPPMPKGENELHYQIRNFHSFLWASGGSYSDFLIHNIDECCMMKDAWPVKALGYGGRHYRGNYIDQNFDSYTTEFTFADGTKLIMEGRNIDKCYGDFASYAHGTKGSAIISAKGHWPAPVCINKGQTFGKPYDNGPKDIVWAYQNKEAADGKEGNPYQREWDMLLEAIRKDKPWNEVKRGAEASLVTAMGRLACHTGVPITFEDALNWKHEFGPDVDKLTDNSPPPVVADKDGRYPIPQPGILTTAEYQAPARS